MKTLEIRQATKADFGAVVDLCKSSLAVTYGAFLDAEAMRPWSEGDELDKYVPARLGSLLIAVDDGLVVGMVAVEDDLIGQLWVAPERRSQGIGKVLLAAAESMIRERGHATLRVEVFEPNVGAVRFYERHGWTRQGTYPEPMAGVDMVRMAKSYPTT